MLVNSSKPFWTYVVWRLDSSHVQVSFKSQNGKSSVKSVHTYPGQIFRKGDKIKCVSEVLDGQTILHQDRLFLYNTLYEVGKSYDLRILWLETDSDGETYLDLIDDFTTLRLRYYCSLSIRKNDELARKSIEGAVVTFNVKSVDSRGPRLKLKTLAGFYNPADTGPNYARKVNQLLGGDNSKLEDIYILDSNLEIVETIIINDKNSTNADFTHRPVTIKPEVTKEDKDSQESANEPDKLVSSSEKGSSNVITDGEKKSAVSRISRFSSVEKNEVIASDVNTKKREQSARVSPNVNYVQRQITNSETGKVGEEWVVEYEKAILADAGKQELADKVIWASKEIGDGLGYDILSFNPDKGTERYIEVKTTCGDRDSAFYISSNELKFSKAHPESFSLYRLYDYDAESQMYKLLIINGDLSTLCTDPESYYVKLQQ